MQIYENLDLIRSSFFSQDKIRSLQENYNVARENLLLFKSKVTVLDQVKKFVF